MRPTSLLVVSSLALLMSGFGCGGGATSSQPVSTPPPTPPTGSSSNPTPGITSVTPASLTAGSSSQNVTVNGSGFIQASVVNLNGAPLTTTYVSSSVLTAAVPAAAIAADGTDKLTVANPAPGGGSSAVQSYSITIPTPGVTAISPQSVPAGAAVTITITGAGFEANSVAHWNGAARVTTFVNATTLQVALTVADVQNFGTGLITVANPGIAPTTPIELVVLSNTPTITYVSPNTAAVSTTATMATQVLIGGSGFAANAIVQANGQIVPIVSQSATSMTVNLAASYFAVAGVVNVVVSNPGPPAVSSNAGVITVQSPTAAPFSVSPNFAPAGSPDTTVTLYGSNFFADSVVYWNTTALTTTFADTNTLTAVIPAALLTGLTQASISVSTPENATLVPPPQPFDTFLQLPINDIVYNPSDGFIYASVPGVTGPGLGNSIAAIDPVTGVIEKTIFVGSEPTRMALSTDGTQLFVGLNGAGAVRRVDLTTGTAEEQTSLGGGPGIYNPPYTALSLAAVPGEPNSVAVYGSNGVVTIFDSGVPRTNTSSGLSIYFDSNSGALAFGSSALSLYVTSTAIGGYLYNLTIDATGVTADTSLPSSISSYYSNTMQYDNGRLYFNSGTVVDATTGDQLGQFSTASSYNGGAPVAAAGPIFSDSSANRAWIVSNNSNNQSEVLSFNEQTFDPVSSLAVTGVGATTSPSNSVAADLVRWGQNGLAFHTANQLYVLQGPIVKDISGSPADLSVSVQAPATVTTGSTLTFTVQVTNNGPSPAQGVSLTATLPGFVSSGSFNSSQGTCSGSGTIFCDLGSISSASSATFTVAVTPTNAATVELTASVSSVSYDPYTANNQASASSTVTGSQVSAPPVATQLSPSLVQSGSGTFTLTVNGAGFTSASTVMWNGKALPTTLLSSGQLTATVDSSLTQSLGWSLVSVSTAAPGGGQSAALPFSIFQILNVPANAVTYDPFTRKLYAVLPSTATPLAGNTVVAIDPASGTIGTPVQVGSEPNLISETSDGNYLYIGLSGARSLGRFNLLTQSTDLTVPLPTNANYSPGDAAAFAIAAVPGSDTSLAVEIDSFDGIGILDISGSTGTFRAKSGFGYSGDYPVFVDPTHFYAYDTATSGSEFYRYTVDANGAELIDGTTLEGLGGYGGSFAVDGGLVFGAGGGIVNPSATPPSQVAVLPLGASLYGGGVVPYAAESKSFNIAGNSGGTPLTYLERFDTQHFTLDEQIALPGQVSGAVAGVRWGQDGLAYVLPVPSTGTNAPTAEILTVRGPFVLPAEAATNAAPSVSSTTPVTIAVGSGNVYVTVVGSGFLPGATVLWNGSPRTTNFVDSAHLTVAIAAADVKAAGTAAVSCQNPGSVASGAVNITVQ